MTLVVIGVHLQKVYCANASAFTQLSKIFPVMCLVLFISCDFQLHLVAFRLKYRNQENTMLWPLDGDGNLKKINISDILQLLFVIVIAVLMPWHSHSDFFMKRPPSLLTTTNMWGLESTLRWWYVSVHI